MVDDELFCIQQRPHDISQAVDVIGVLSDKLGGRDRFFFSGLSTERPQPGLFDGAGHVNRASNSDVLCFVRCLNRDRRQFTQAISQPGNLCFQTGDLILPVTLFPEWLQTLLLCRQTCPQRAP